MPAFCASSCLGERFAFANSFESGELGHRPQGYTRICYTDATHLLTLDTTISLLHQVARNLKAWDAPWSAPSITTRVVVRLVEQHLPPLVDAQPIRQRE